MLLPLCFASGVACSGKSSDTGPGSADGSDGADGGDGGSGTAPDAATDLSGVAISPTQADLAGTDNATDETGFRVERSPAGAEAFMEIGTVDADATSFSDVAAPGGSVEYRFVAVNDTGDEAPSNSALVHLPLGAQAATHSIDMNSMAVTMVTQPANSTLGGSATWSGTGTPLELTVGATNDVNRLVFNLKGVVRSVNEGTATATGTYDGAPYTYFGANRIEVGETRDAVVTLDGVTGASDPLLVDLELPSHPMLFGTTDDYGGNLHIYDGGGAGEVGEIDVDSFG